MCFRWSGCSGLGGRPAAHTVSACLSVRVHGSGRAYLGLLSCCCSSHSPRPPGHRHSAACAAGSVCGRPRRPAPPSGRFAWLGSGKDKGKKRMKDAETLYKDTRGPRWERICTRHADRLTKKYAKTFSLPSSTPENRNCHQSLETISQLNGQTAKIPILDLAQFYLPSLTTVVDMVQNSFGNHDQMFHQFTTLRVTQLSFSSSC